MASNTSETFSPDDSNPFSLSPSHVPTPSQFSDESVDENHEENENDSTENNPFLFGTAEV